jgi:hypothetical protein
MWIRAQICVERIFPGVRVCDATVVVASKGETIVFVGAAAVGRSLKSAIQRLNFVLSAA